MQHRLPMAYECRIRWQEDAPARAIDKSLRWPFLVTQERCPSLGDARAPGTVATMMVYGDAGKDAVD